MKKIIKKIALVLAVLITVAVFPAACTIPPPNNFEKVDPGVLPPKVEDRDYSPLKRYDQTLTINVLGTNFEREGSVVATYQGRPSGPKNQSFNDLALQHLNIKLNYVTVAAPAQYENNLNLLIAGNNLPDIIVTGNSTTFETLRKSGMVSDIADVFYYLNDELQEMFMTEYYYKGLETCMVEGQLFAIPNVSNTFENAQRFYIRRDWLELVNKSVPTTAEQLLDVARAFRDNAALIASKQEHIAASDIIPIGMHKDIQFEGSYGAQGFFEMFGAHVDAFFADSSDNIYSSNTSPEMKTALTVMRQMYSEGLIHPEFYNHGNSRVAGDVIAGKIGIISGQWWVPGYPLGESVANEFTPTADWVPIELVGYGGKSALPVVSRLLMGNYNMVNKNFAHPEALARLMNLFFDVYYNDNALEIYGAGSTAEGGLYHSWIPVKLWHSSASIVEHERVKAAFDDLYDAGYRMNNAEIIAAGDDYDWDSLYAYVSGHEVYGPIFNRMKTREKTIHFKLGYAYHVALKEGKRVNNMDVFEKRGFGIHEEMVKEDSGYSYVRALTRGEKPAKFNEFYGVATPTQQEKGEYINSYMKTYFMKVITGESSISDWDNFVKEYNKNGGTDITAEINQWYRA